MEQEITNWKQDRADSTLIIFGNITLEEQPKRATVHEVVQTLILPRYIAAKVADELVNVWDAWIIPSEYKGEIIWE